MGRHDGEDQPMTKRRTPNLTSCWSCKHTQAQHSANGECKMLGCDCVAFDDGSADPDLEAEAVMADEEEEDLDLDESDDDLDELDFDREQRARYGDDEAWDQSDDD